MFENNSESVLRKNPSRVECESIIKRILSAEVLTTGRNARFKSANDFMSYFESLYPASDSLNKQVQRAIKSMNLPKDPDGYLIINKTLEQIGQEKDFSYFLKRSNSHLVSLEECETLLLRCDPKDADMLMKLCTECSTLNGKYETALPTNNGILFYTKNKNHLRIMLQSLIGEEEKKDNL